MLAVSFDDGYLDNFEHAAPILLKHQVPCTFFISTQKVSRQPAVRARPAQLGFGLDNMSWAQVQTMHNWGFQFGSHTRNHVNLADISDELALQELEGSMNDIRTRLGQQEVFIAYPFGGKQHINSVRVGMLKSLGYGACFSAVRRPERARHRPLRYQAHRRQLVVRPAGAAGARARMGYYAMNDAPLMVHLTYILDFGGLESLMVERINRMPADDTGTPVIALTKYTDFSKKITRPGVQLFALHKQPGLGLGLHVKCGSCCAGCGRRLSILTTSAAAESYRLLRRSAACHSCAWGAWS